jgi:CBS domain-containing protein
MADKLKLLIESGPPNVILVRDAANPASACNTFDYSDLNAYLLIVLGLANPSEEQVEPFSEIAKKAREGTVIPLKDVVDIEKKEPIVFLSEREGLAKAIEIFGSGVHRLIITAEETGKVIGILSQLKVVRFLWDNGRSFPVIDQLYPIILRDLNIGSQQIIAIK